jgi:membrane protein YqaA with SNARE-associated domain
MVRHSSLPFGGLLSIQRPQVDIIPSVSEHAAAERSTRSDSLRVEPEPDSLQVRGPAWVGRLEYVLLAAIVALITTTAFVFFFFDIDLAKLSTYGYAGLFLVTLVSAASIVLPMPGAAAITGAGAVLDPVWGIPVPLLVGIVAGVAETIGELTGYAAGYGGSPLFREKSFYPRVHAWMQRRGVLTLFLLSCVPNPLVDVAGVAAGAVHMPVGSYLTGVLPGKFVKNVYLSAGGLAASELIRHFLG